MVIQNMKETEVRVGDMAILSWSGLASWRRWHLSQVLKEVLAVTLGQVGVPGRSLWGFGMGTFWVSWPRTTGGPCLVVQGLSRGHAWLLGSDLWCGAWHSATSSGIVWL